MKEINWFTEAQIEEALEASKTTLRPIFIDFWSPGCKGCAKMDAVSYEDDSVIRFLYERFICIKYNTKSPNTYLKKLTGHAPLLWSPTFVVLDYHLSEMRRIVGYLPPEELLAELTISEGLIELLHTNAHGAYLKFESVIDDFSETHAAPEALYWLGVAAFRRNGRSLKALIPKWQAIYDRYPQSVWWTKADVSDTKIPLSPFQRPGRNDSILIENLIGD